MMLTTSKRQSIRMAVVVVATVVNYCLNVYLIPSYGTVGAAYSSLITAILVGVGHALPTRPFFREWVFQTRVVVPLIATAAIGGVLWSLRAIPLWYTAPPALAVCGVVAYFVGYSEEERRFMLGRSGDGIDLKRKFRQMF
jgi:O-antigen/teichoic acid export membrane protein